MPEESLILLLRDALHLNREKPADNMDIDDPSASSTKNKPFTLEHVLGHIISYPTSAPPLRLAIRQNLPDMEDVTVLLRILDDMIKKSISKSVDITLGDPLKSGKDPNREKGMGKSGIPRLDLVSNCCNSFEQF